MTVDITWDDFEDTFDGPSLDTTKWQGPFAYSGATTTETWATVVDGDYSTEFYAPSGTGITNSIYVIGDSPDVPLKFQDETYLSFKLTVDTHLAADNYVIGRGIDVGLATTYITGGQLYTDHPMAVISFREVLNYSVNKIDGWNLFYQIQGMASFETTLFTETFTLPDVSYWKFERVGSDIVFTGSENSDFSSPFLSHTQTPTSGGSYNNLRIEPYILGNWYGFGALEDSPVVTTWPKVDDLHYHYSVIDYPDADLSIAPDEGDPPLNVIADASGSTGGAISTIVSYTYSWGDGTDPETTTSPTATHTYATWTSNPDYDHDDSTGGVYYEASVTVLNSYGFESTDYYEVFIYAPPPGPTTIYYDPNIVGDTGPQSSQFAPPGTR